MSFDDNKGLKLYLREIGKTDLLIPQQEVELAERIKKGDPEARSHMIQANLRLVVKIAQDYSNYGLPLLDLISEGNIGLMKAVERFDPNKGGKLSTYAAWWIKQSIKRALANQSKTIRLPVHMVDKISKMRRIAMSLSEELGREPTDEELSAEIGIPREKLAAMKVAAMRPASLDAPVSAEDDTEFGELVGDERDQGAAENLMRTDDLQKVLPLLDYLDPRERKIIDARFGLDGQKPRTLEEVGEEFQVTRERIRQLQNIALKKLRRALQKKEKGAMRPAQNIAKKPKKTPVKIHKVPRVLSADLSLSMSEGTVSKVHNGNRKRLRMPGGVNFLLVRCGFLGDGIEDKMLEKLGFEAVSTLSPREQAIINLRYFFTTERQPSQSDILGQIGGHQAAVSLVERGAIGKIIDYISARIPAPETVPETVPMLPTESKQPPERDPQSTKNRLIIKCYFGDNDVCAIGDFHLLGETFGLNAYQVVQRLYWTKTITRERAKQMIIREEHGLKTKNDAFIDELLK